MSIRQYYHALKILVLEREWLARHVINTLMIMIMNNIYIALNTDVSKRIGPGKKREV